MASSYFPPSPSSRPSPSQRHNYTHRSSSSIASIGSNTYRNRSPRPPAASSPATTASPATLRRRAQQHSPPNHTVDTPNHASNSRKRSRRDEHPLERHSKYQPSPSRDIRRPVYASRTTSVDSLSGPASPPPLINSMYKLAGGLDTPTANAEAQFDFGAEDLSDTDFRRGWAKAATPRARHVRSENALARERNGGRGKGAVAGESWGQYMFGMVGGLAGKVWDLWRTGPFKGFTAGQGPSYDMSEAIDGQDRAQSWTIISHGMPGRFPLDEELHASTTSAEEYNEYTDDADYTDARPSKRLQTSKGDGWVMVDAAQTHSQTRPSPAQTKSLLPRPVSRQMSRPSIARLSGVSASGSPGLRTHTATPRQGSASRVATRSSTAGESPLSPEVQEFEARRAREEQQADESMRKLNMQLKAMIRQGKEALSSQVVVDDDDEELGRQYEMDRVVW